MRFFIVILLFSVGISSHAQLWVEDFSGEANGATSGVAGGTQGGTWSVTTTPSGTFSKVTLLGDGFFRADQTVTEGVWSTNSIDISGTGMATISVELLTGGTNSSDYIRAYYKVDGGSEILFAELLGQIINVSTTGSAIVSGNNLQVIV
jgi:trimeric autotransporter adhesin